MNLELLENGNEAAWNEAHSLLWGIALSAAEKAHPSLSREDHEDVAILAISELVDKIEHVTDERHLRSLLATISHHQAVSLARKKFSAKRSADKIASLDAEIENQGDGILEESAPKPDETLHQAEVTAFLHAALEEVKESYRQILKDRYWNDLDYRELAEKHQLSENSVGVYLRRGLEELRAILERKPDLLKEIQPVLR